jgi:thymidine phosphorylase
VPMIAGRGLGHTGGTLDKLDAIPGYTSQPDIDTFRRVVREVGCAIIGQTADLAPADRRLYAIRDVTATVESLDLITASILSKKLAAGLQGLVMDVKFGSGAFMQDPADARALAESLVLVAGAAGLPTSALLTGMDQPLASAAGNALEVAYIVDYLTGARRERRFHEVTMALGADMLVLARLAPDVAAAQKRIEEVLASGAAAEKFSRMVAALGGPADLLDRPGRHLPRAPVVRAVHSDAPGIVQAVATREVGLAVVALGGGRTRPQDAIDHAVGFTDLASVGERVDGERPLAVVHASSDAQAGAAAEALRRAYSIAERKPQTMPLILERIGAAA